MKLLGYQGIAFGIMDGVITSLGIITGLSAFQNSLVLFLAVIITGVADAFANAAGMHVSEEAEKLHGRQEVWKITLNSFFSTISVFIILATPLLFIPFHQAVLVSWIGGMLLLVWLGLFVSEGKDKLRVVIEYVAIGVAISLISFLLGNYAKSLVG
jgi:VIT1/CCC1 family predicted Fe2+/Mn2+ transporter